ncbi:hypothetical protein ABIB00_001753 [Bradyrhizobium sp. LB14.3]|uniref:hypothetical protein n=1 Tax=Bradyrhizobium sp. LB14.3 TaxID=3156328 RepID=UPI00339B5699
MLNEEIAALLLAAVATSKFSFIQNMAKGQMSDIVQKEPSDSAPERRHSQRTRRPLGCARLQPLLRDALRASDAGLLLLGLIRRGIQSINESAILEHSGDSADQCDDVVLIAQDGSPACVANGLDKIPRQRAAGRFELLFGFLQRSLIAVRHPYIPLHFHLRANPAIQIF